MYKTSAKIFLILTQPLVSDKLELCNKKAFIVYKEASVAQ